MRRIASCGVSLLLALAPGCLRGGEAWIQTPRDQPPATAKAPRGDLELIVLGSPRASSATAAVAVEIERLLAAAHAAERPSMVAWLGTDFGRPGLDRARPCPTPDAAYAEGPLAELGRVLAQAEERGTSSWGLPGPDGLRCGLHEQPAPYAQPALHYVIRVYSSGELELASRCEGPRCELLPEREPADDPVRVELVFGELAAWHYPDMLEPEADEQLEQQGNSLLEAIAAAPPRPRIFLSSIPLDSAGAHGLGGRLQRTGIRYLPTKLRQAVEAGHFVGFVGGLERNLQVSANLSPSILRNRRAVVAKPVFGVVSGAAGGAATTPPTSRGDAMIPELEAARAGFVRILIHGDQVRIEAHARAGRSWRVASVEVPLNPEPFRGLHPSPVIQPCPACDPKGGAGDGEPL